MATEAAYGTDLSCIDDLTPNLDEVSGRTVGLQAALRRLTTGRGMVLDCPNDGIDLRDFLSGELTEQTKARMRAIIESELVKDERFFSATVTAMTFVQALKSMRVRILLIDADGPFTLTLAVSDVSIDILEVT
jgi:hypothetical protein